MTRDRSLDTSGSVSLPRSPQSVIRNHLWSDLSPFEQGYIEGIAMEKSWVDGRVSFAFSDLAHATLAAIRRDCASFKNIAEGLGVKKLDAAEGRNFWVGRNQSHGWAPTFAAAFPPLTVTLGDDGKIYLKGQADDHTRS